MMLGLAAGLGWLAQDGLTRYLFMQREAALSGDQIPELEQGDSVWFEAEAVAPVESDRGPWFDDHVYGCRQAFDDSEDGSWSTVDVYHPAIWVEVDGVFIQVILPEGCPEGSDYATSEEGHLRYKGYEIGQLISVTGRVSGTGDPLVVVVESHHGGSAEARRRDVLYGFGLAFFLACCSLYRIV